LVQPCGTDPVVCGFAVPICVVGRRAAARGQSRLRSGCGREPYRCGDEQADLIQYCHHFV